MYDPLPADQGLWSDSLAHGRGATSACCCRILQSSRKHSDPALLTWVSPASLYVQYLPAALITNNIPRLTLLEARGYEKPQVFFNKHILDCWSKHEPHFTSTPCSMFLLLRGILITGDMFRFRTVTWHLNNPLLKIILCSKLHLLMLQCPKTSILLINGSRHLCFSY